MPTVRTKRELSAVKRDANDVIKMNKADIKEALSEYQRISRVVKRTGQAYQKRQKTAEKSGSERAALRSERAEEAYRFTRREYDAVRKRLNDCLSAIAAEYSRIIDAYRSLGNVKAMERAYGELDSYRDGVLSTIEKIDTATPNLLGTDELDLDGLDYLDEPEYPDEPEIREEPRKTERREPPRAPEHVSSTVTSVTVDPVSIDVTPIVERAIESFVARLDAGLSARLDEYVKGIELPTVSVAPTVAAAPAASGEITELSTELLSEEEHIVEKLRTMCTSIVSLLEEMTALSASYHDISLKCKELAELQRTVNDMQRHTAREQKGVEVNQKLIADEQAEIIAAGTLLAESQKELAERQSALAALESEAVAISEKNTAEMERIISAERALADRQAELVNLSRKLSDSIEQSILRESELYAEQKETLSVTKKLIREQRQLSEKVASAKPQKKSRPKSENAGEATEISPAAEPCEDNKITEE